MATMFQFPFSQIPVGGHPGNISNAVEAFVVHQMLPSSRNDGWGSKNSFDKTWTENFTGSNGDSWSDLWTPTTNGGVATIQSNAGQLVTPSGAYVGDEVTFRPAQTPDFHLTFDVTFSSLAEQFLSLSFRYDGGDNYWFINFTPADSNPVNIWYHDAGGQHYWDGIGSPSGWGGLTIGSPVHVDLLCQGALIKWAAWSGGGDAPFYVNDQDDAGFINFNQGISLGFVSGAAGTPMTTTFDNWVLTAL